MAPLNNYYYGPVSYTHLDVYKRQVVRDAQGDKIEPDKTTEGININNLMEMLQEALKKQSIEDRKDNETLFKKWKNEGRKTVKH